MEGAGGAWCDGAVLRFRRHDPGRRLSGVRVLSSAFRADLAYRPELGSWELCRERPPLWRLEYRLELTHADGTRSEEGPRELRCPDYAEPEWLTVPAAPGVRRRLRLPGLGTAVVWSPSAATGRALVAHDGADYDRLGGLGRFAATTGVPFHLVLLPVRWREEWYSADPGYAALLGRRILPRIRAALGAGPVIGAGVSLGALAMLHAQRACPEGFAGLFLQSGSYFQPRYDRQESGFRRWGRIVRFTGRMRAASTGPAVPVAMTCGAAEENLANNRDMADFMRKQGYPVAFAENPDAHTWTGWRDALHPHLTDLLRRVWPD
ncbi:esterase [Actinoplanes sp. NPDC049802]|uniref:alpha/beta hydrolase n=1 Tax=Actinoplanes sp. NPDC049802 TaxID=3154742 RepID=UPI0033D197A5